MLQSKLILFLSFFTCFKCDFESMCNQLNQNGSHCTFKCFFLDTDEKIVNYTNIKITLSDLDAIPQKSFSNLSIYSLTIIDPNFSLEMMNKLSDVKDIDQFSLENLESLNSVLSDDKIFFSKKIKSFTIKDIVNVDQDSVIKLLKTIDKLGVAEFRLTNIRIKRLSLDLTIFKNFLKLIFIFNQIDYFEVFLGKNTRDFQILKCQMKELNIRKSNDSILLENLSLIDNNLSSIYFPELYSLTDLSLFINSLKYITNENLKNLKSLRVLEIGSNSLISIESESFRSLKNLVFLNLDNNFLNESLRLTYLDRLEALTMRSNFFRSFSSLTNLNNPLKLESLDLSFNMLEMISLDLPSLKKISLINNRLKIIDLIYGLDIDLSSNFLTLSKINFKHLNIIQSIELVSNSITSISKEEILKLENSTSINLSNNFIENAEFPFMKYLRILILSNNKIRRVNKTTFSNLKYLTELYLPSNLIEIIEFGSFILNTNLEILILNNNFLNYIPDLSYLNYLNHLDLNHQLKIPISLSSNMFGNFFELNKSYSKFYLMYNNFRIDSTRIFCSKNLQNIEIYISNLDHFHKCLFKQIQNRNVSFSSLSNVTCEMLKMAEKSNISFNNYNKNKLNCSNYKLDDNCENEANLKYNCSYEQKNFEIVQLEIFGLECCDIQQNVYCLKNEYYYVNCSTKNSNNSSLFGSIYDYKFFMIDKEKNFKIIRFSCGSMLIYHVTTDTMLNIINSGSFYSFILKTNRYSYSKMSGLLKTGCFSDGINDNFNSFFDTNGNRFFKISKYISSIDINNKFQNAELTKTINEIQRNFFPNQTVVFQAKSSTSRKNLQIFNLSFLFYVGFYFV